MFDPNQPDPAAAAALASLGQTVQAAPAAPVAPAINYTDLDASNGAWGTRDLALKYPFKFKGANYDKLTFREPNGFDIDLAMRAGSGDMVSTLLVNLATQPIEIFNVMHGQDRAAATKLVGEFLAGSPAT